MAITETNILSRVNQITGREETSILTELAEVLEELSYRLYAIKSSAAGTLSANTSSFAVPSDFIDVDVLEVDDEELDRITYEEYKQGYINGYAVYNGNIYVNPTPGSDKTYTLYYFGYHAAVSSGGTISFNDKYKNAIIYGVCEKVYDNYEINDRAEYMRKKFEIELAKYPPDNIYVSKARKTRV